LLFTTPQITDSWLDIVDIYLTLRKGNLFGNPNLSTTRVNKSNAAIIAIMISIPPWGSGEKNSFQNKTTLLIKIAKNTNIDCQSITLTKS
jgi:hypothetical protein